MQDLSKQLLPVSAESVGASAQQSHIPAYQLGELGMENRGERERETHSCGGRRACVRTKAAKLVPPDVQCSPRPSPLLGKR